MARRGNGKPKKAKAGNPAGISERTRKNLTKQLANARRRVAGMIERYGVCYTGPQVQDFYLENVLDLMKNGTHINTIYAMIRNATDKKYQKQQKQYKRKDPIVTNMYGGAPVHQSQYSKLVAALAQANKNINDAKNQFPDKDDMGILPSKMSPDDILSRVTSTRRLNEVIDTITRAFVPEKLVPSYMVQTGEAVTMAEIEYLNSFITEENRKRKVARDEVKEVFDRVGRFQTQQEFALTDVDTTRWDTLDKWRRRTEFFTDAHALDKARLWMGNFMDSFNRMISIARVEGIVTDTNGMEEHISVVMEYLARLDSEELIRSVTRYSEYIQVMANYKETAEEIRAEIVNLEMSLAQFFGEADETWVYM